MTTLGDAVGVTFQVTRGRQRGGVVMEPVEEAGREVTRALPDHVLLDAMATLYGLPRCVVGMGSEEWTTAARPRAHELVLRAMKLDT
jgi:hypothetical protein